MVESMKINNNNPFFTPTLKYKEMMLLEYIEKHPDTTQKELGKIIGSAASMINLYLDEGEAKGYLKREYLSSKTIKYHITAKGKKRKNYLNISYMQELINYYMLAKKELEDFLLNATSKGYHKIILYGAGEVCEIILTTLKNSTKLNITIPAIIDDDLEKRGKEIENIPIISKVDLDKYPHDAIFISSYTYEEQIAKELKNIGYEEDRIIKFFDGRK